MDRTHQLTLACALTVPLLCAGTLLWLRLRPETSDAELAEAWAKITAERAESARATCHRAAFGDGPPATREQLDALVHGAQFADCYRRISEGRLFDRPEDGDREWTWDADEGDLAALGQPPGVTYLVNYGPLLPNVSPNVAAAEVACAPAVAVVARAAANTDRCSPFRPTARDWLDEDDVGRTWRLANAVGLMARARARRGDVEGALMMLVRSLPVIRDMGRGPTHFMAAGAAVTGQQILVAHVQTLVTSEPGLSAEAYQGLDALLALLERTPSKPSATLHVGQVAVAESYHGIDTEEARREVFVVASQELDWCPPGATAGTCLSHLRGGPPPRASHVLLPRWLVGPRISRGARLQATDWDLRTTMRRNLAVLVTSDMLPRMLRVLLWLSEKRSEGDCHPTLDPDLLQVEDADAPITIAHPAGQICEITAPAPRALPGADRLVLTFACPAAQGHWEPVAH